MAGLQRTLGIPQPPAASGGASYVTSVGITVPTGLQVSPAAITTSGVFVISYASGYQGYTTAEATKLSGITAGADPTGATINAATAKTTPVDADNVPLIDSAASNALKKVTWANIKATLKTYFDTLYAAVTHTHTASQISDASANGRSLITAADYAAMRTLLSLVPGTNVQAYDSDLQAIAALSPTNGYVIVGNGSAWTAAAPSSSALPTFIAVDEKTSGTAGGSSTASTHVTRTLNTVKTNTISGASLASNQITLPAGTYDCFARAPAKEANSHKIRLFNVTDGAVLIVGGNARISTGPISTTDSTLVGRFTLAATKNICLQHYIVQSYASEGLGEAVNNGDVEVYAAIKLEKVA